MTPYRIVPAARLQPGPATVIVALGARTLRSRVVMVAAEPHGVVRVAFESGDILALSPRSAVGVVEPLRARPRRPRRAGRGSAR